MDKPRRKPVLTAIAATVCLTLAACSFCAGWFLSSVTSYGDKGFSVVAERRAPVDWEPEKIDLNSATAEELESLNGIGPALAQRIVAYREEHGPFEDCYAIMEVQGIGASTYEKIRDLICVGSQGSNG